MTLADWLYYNKTSVVEFARRIGTTTGYMSIIKNGHRIPSRKVAAKIEEATDGKVKKEELLFPSPQTEMIA